MANDAAADERLRLKQNLENIQARVFTVSLRNSQPVNHEKELLHAIVHDIVDGIALEQYDYDLLPVRTLTKLREDIFPNALFHPDVLQCSALYKGLKDLIARCGIKLEAQRNNDKIPIKFARTLYMDDDESLNSVRALRARTEFDQCKEKHFNARCR